ncbi:MAG: SUMF1/EgtB/PvdO family nonheme iron enzyme, partial [Chloroflexi bacterium]|nr:SUMF1/EgtB/PvdO family nonheme iron enzyme [Chloroflexota bacterium]
EQYHPDYDTMPYPFTSPVGSFAPNGYGLYDMVGNVYEWCWDWWDYYSNSPGSDPRGPDSGTYRVVRGGSWGADAYRARCARRYDYPPGGSGNYNGFRCVCR